MPSLGDRRVFGGQNQVWIPGAGWITDTSTGQPTPPSPGQPAPGTPPSPPPPSPIQYGPGPSIPAPVVPQISAGGNTQQMIARQALQNRLTEQTVSGFQIANQQAPSQTQTSLSPLSQSLTDITRTQQAEFGVRDTNGRGSRAARADLLTNYQPPTPGNFLTQLDPNTPAMGAFLQLIGGIGTSAVGGAVEGAFAEIERGPEGEQPLGIIQRFGDVTGAALLGAFQGAQEAFLGDPNTVDLEAPPVSTPWWQGMPGGPGMFAGMEDWIAQGNLLPDVTPQIQIALGMTNTDMLAAGYVWDDATGKWIIPESQSIEDAQAGLGGTGGGGFAGSGGGGFSNFQFPPSARTGSGLGLTNWRI